MSGPDVSRRSPLPLLVAFLLLVQFVLAPGYVDNVDSRIVMRTAERLLDAGTWSLGDVEGTYFASAEYGTRGPDGAHQMKFGPGNALLAAPFLAAGRAAHGLAGLDAGRAGEAALSLASALWFAAAGALVYLLARRVQEPRFAVATALLHSFGTYALVYGKSSYLEMPLTVAVLGAWLAALRARDAGGAPGPALALGAACAAILWIKVAAVVLLLGLLPILAAGTRRSAVRTAAWAAGPVLVGAAALAALNAARFGSALATGYGPSLRFDTPLLGGIADLLASERGGLFLFAPPLLLLFAGFGPLRRRDAGLAWSAPLALLPALLLYGTFFSPFGGDAWGPRYLLPNAALLAIPAGVGAEALLRGGTAARAAACAVVAAGVLLQAPPALVSFHEIYTLRDRVPGRLPPPIPLAGRILLAKLGGAGDRYDLATLGAGTGRHEVPRVEQGLNLWPARVAREMPARRGAAWAAWAAIVGGAAAAGAALGVRTRGAA